MTSYLYFSSLSVNRTEQVHRNGQKPRINENYKIWRKAIIFSWVLKNYIFFLCKTQEVEQALYSLLLLMPSTSRLEPQDVDHIQSCPFWKPKKQKLLLVTDTTYCLRLCLSVLQYQTTIKRLSTKYQFQIFMQMKHIRLKIVISTHENWGNWKYCR